MDAFGYIRAGDLDAQPTMAVGRALEFRDRAFKMAESSKLVSPEIDYETASAARQACKSMVGAPASVCRITPTDLVWSSGEHVSQCGGTIVGPAKGRCGGSQ